MIYKNPKSPMDNFTNSGYVMVKLRGIIINIVNNSTSLKVIDFIFEN